MELVPLDEVKETLNVWKNKKQKKKKVKKKDAKKKKMENDK